MLLLVPVLCVVVAAFGQLVAFCVVASGNIQKIRWATYRYSSTTSTTDSTQNLVALEKRIKYSKICRKHEFQFGVAHTFLHSK